jgi:hypothetical protein
MKTRAHCPLFIAVRLALLLALLALGLGVAQGAPAPLAEIETSTQIRPLVNLHNVGSVGQTQALAPRRPA